MLVKFHNTLAFHKLIVESGYTPSSLSRAIQKSRSYIFLCLRRNTISPLAAQSVCSILKKDFNEFFLIDSSTKVS